MSTKVCRWCGYRHGVLCPHVKAIEYQADGTTVKRVEFHAPDEPRREAVAGFLNAEETE